MSMERMDGIDIAVGSEASLQQKYKLPISTIYSEVSEIPSIFYERHTGVRGGRSKLLRDILTPKTPTKKQYFTTRKGDGAGLGKATSPFLYPGDMEEFAHKVLTRAWRNDAQVNEEKLKCFQKSNYQQKQRADLLSRIYVDEPTTDTVEEILKLNPNYFSVIQGRPKIIDKIKMRDYLDLIRESLRIKIVTGYREDDIMLIEQKLIYEQMLINAINKNYQTYVDTFEEFLARDHTSAKALLEKAEEMSRISYQAYEEYKIQAKKYGALRSSVFPVEEKWRNCRAYQKLLFNLSPLWWRNHQKAIQSTKNFNADEYYGDEGNIFSKYRKSLLDRGFSLTDILGQFESELGDNSPPKLYFTEPAELLDALRFIETQNLNGMLHCEELANPLDRVRNGMKMAEKIFDREIRSLHERIDKLEGGIDWEERRVTYLEELATSLVQGEFKHLLRDDSVLNLHVFIEDIYETVIAPNDANLTMSAMMNAIEDMYRNEILVLDMIPSEQVAKLEHSIYSEEVFVMKLAEKAAKQFAEFERLTNSLNKAFAPAYKKPSGKGVKKRSNPVRPAAKAKLPVRVLTEEEAEYLEYFTDFCKLVDDPKDYGINLEVREKEIAPTEDVIECDAISCKTDKGRRFITIADEINAYAAAKKR